MNNIVLLHKNYRLSKMYLNYFIALIPLVLYGIYKNGILLYLDGSINFYSILKPLLLPVIGGLLGVLSHYILKKEIKINKMVLNGFIIGMIMPISVNLIIFIISVLGLLLVSQYLENKFSFNVICFIKLIIVGILMLFKSYQYANLVELSRDYAFSFVDVLFGRGIGGICTSSILGIFLGFSFLLFDYYYKKEIPIYAMITYVIVHLISFVFIKDLSVVVNNIFASSIFFAFVFVAPLPYYSSATSKGKMFFGIAIGILTAILTFFLGVFESAFIAILLCSFFRDYFDKRQMITK